VEPHYICKRRLLVKKLRFFGVSALALILGMTVLGCKDDLEYPPAPTPGQLTLTGITGHEGDYVLAEGYTVGGAVLQAVGSIDAATGGARGAQISSGQATLNVYNVTSGIPVPYTGTTTVTFDLGVYGSNAVVATDNRYIGMTGMGQTTGAVSLSGGNGSGSCAISALMGILHLTGLEDYNGKYVLAANGGYTLMAIGNFDISGVHGAKITSGQTHLLIIDTSFNIYTGSAPETFNVAIYNTQVTVTSTPPTPNAIGSVTTGALTNGCGTGAVSGITAYP
jgi:hypothetical protein